MRILSVDAETNGLYGAPFAIGMVVRDTHGADWQFIARCPIDGDIDPWVAEHVLPALAGVAITHPTDDALLAAFWQAYRSEADDATAAGETLICVAHCASPVESGLFRRCVEADPAARQFQAPFPLHDVASMLLMARENPLSVRAFLASRAITVPFDGAAHHPLFDAWTALLATEALLAGRPPQSLTLNP